jgi:type III secretory pathway lipoprotein EscJ
MKMMSKILFALLVVVLLAACNRNYYSGTGKGGKNCGCPSHKGMTGY